MIYSRSLMHTSNSFLKKQHPITLPAMWVIDRGSLRWKPSVKERSIGNTNAMNFESGPWEFVSCNRMTAAGSQTEEKPRSFITSTVWRGRGIEAISWNSPATGMLGGLESMTAPDIYGQMCCVDRLIQAVQIVIWWLHVLCYTGRLHFQQLHYAYICLTCVQPI